MKARNIVTFVVIGAMFASLPSMGSAAAKGKKKKAAGPMVVGTDEVGDWGANVDPTLAPLADMLGQDVVEAIIAPGEKGNINFIIKVNALPPTGGIPESSRYNWDIIVDGEAFQLSGAFTDYLRGVCYPLHSGSCPPPQDPGQQPFFIRQGPCTVGSDCFLKGVVNATFDTAEATITIPVPMELIGAKPGSKIAPGTSTLGGTVYAAPSAVISNASLPNDTMLVLKTYTVPK